jgi:hypothetical protein
MIERSVSIILLSLGGTLISYAIALCYHSESHDEATRLLSSGVLLGITLIAFGVMVDRDRRRHEAAADAPIIARTDLPVQQITNAPH